MTEVSDWLNIMFPASTIICFLFVSFICATSLSFLKVIITPSGAILTGVAKFRSAFVAGLLMFISNICHNVLMSFPLGFLEIGGGVNVSS